jgi:hypothetical protein
MYDLGKKLAPIASVSTDAKIKENLGALWFARGALEASTADDSPLLEAAKRAGRQVIATITNIIPTDLDEIDKIDKEAALDYWGYRLKQDLQAFESVIANEMPGVPAYVVSQKGIYRTEDLIEHAEKQFPQEFQPYIPNQAVMDIKEAGKCLAFSLPTACSFHLWRALETVMDAYYAKLTSSTFEADGVSLNWGAKIKALEEKKGEPAVTKYLDHIRQQYRNPQTHPEEMVELNEALMLFGVAASSITAMVTAIQKAKPASSSIPLGDSLAGPSS